MVNWNDYKNFSKWEFACSHTDENRMQPEFLDILQQIRSIFAKPMKINSGYRHWTHPIERAKETPGEHSFGMAADVDVSGQDAAALFVISYGHGIKRLGLYQNKDKTFLHIGMGDQLADFKPAIWTP